MERFHNLDVKNTVPELIDPVFAKTNPKRSFSIIENKRFGLVFAKTGSINSGTGNLFLPGNTHGLDATSQYSPFLH